MISEGTALLIQSIGTLLCITGLLQMKVTLQDNDGTRSFCGQGVMSGRWMFGGLLTLTVGNILHVIAQPNGDMLLFASNCTMAVFINAVFAIFYLKEHFTL